MINYITGAYDSNDWYAKYYISRDGWTQRTPLRDTIKAMVDDYVKQTE